MKPLRTTLFVLAALLCMSCKDDTEPLTQVQVVVRSDLEIGTQLTSLKLELLDADGEELSHSGQTIPLVKKDPDDGEQTLPLSFGIVPAAGDASIRFLLKVRGYGPLEEGGRDEEIVRESVLTGFLPGETTVIYVFLGSQCLQKLCDSEGGGSLMSCDYQTGMCEGVDFKPPVRAPAGQSDDPTPVGCMQGFTSKNGECVDIDECEAESDEPPCGKDAECQNHPGGYRCWCNSDGYVAPDADCTLDEGTVDVCDPSPCDEPGTCMEFDGDFLCECPSGYEENDPGTETCIDIDECELGTDECDPLSTCRNTTGGFVCEDCPDGFEDPEPGDTACIEIGIDVDECELGTDECDPLSTCRNTTGSFVCEDCPSGYDDPAPGDTECEDIDECDLDIDECDPELACVNTIGSFECNGCGDGYADPPPGETSCINIDECTLDIDGCDPLATCEDTVGSYLCDCPDEYFDPEEGDTSCIPMTAGCVVRVRPTGNDANNGSSWALAKATIDGALAVPDVCEVWVAEGLYTPTRDVDEMMPPTNLRDATFELEPDVGVFGGFAGTELQRAQADFLAHPTILSGNIGAAGQTDNTYHVVVGAAGATLSGFFVIGGLADGGSVRNFGAGMFNSSIDGTVTINQMVFMANRANFGAGVLNNLGTKFMVDGSTFLWNHANSGGSGIGASASASMTELTSGTITSSTFYGNTGTFGLGVWVVNAQAEVRNCTFQANVTNLNGSSGALDFGALPTGVSTRNRLINSTFIGNTGVKGAAVWVDSNSPEIVGCSFINNVSDTSACVATRQLSATTVPELINSLFWNNTRMGAQLDVSHEETGSHVADASCARQTLTAIMGSSNTTLAASPSPIASILPSGIAYLEQSAAAPTCLDAASSVHAENAGIQWTALTTSTTGTPDATAPDAGRHVSPEAVAITAISANATTLSWTSAHATSCAWIRNDNHVPHGVSNATTTATHGAPSGTRIAVICSGPEGEPAVASTIVP